MDGRSKVKKGSWDEAQTQPELLALATDLARMSNRLKELLLEERKRLRYPVVKAEEVNIVTYLEPSLDSRLDELDKLAKLVQESIRNVKSP
jgi:hypothetical protein